MSKREPFYDSFSYENDKLILPSDETERKEFARSLFGAMMVACIDVLFEEGQRIAARNPEFSGFTAEQKSKMLSLIGHTLYGTLYWQCVKMDHFNDPALEINIVEHDEDGNTIRSTPVAGPAEEELRNAYSDWVERFGDHYEDNSGFRFSSRWDREFSEVPQPVPQPRQDNALISISDKVMLLLESHALQLDTIPSTVIIEWLHEIYNTAQLGLGKSPLYLPPLHE